jgi:hypothetical protein
MDINTFGRKVGRFAAAAGLAITMSGCGMALEVPPRAMYGTTAWSDAWQVTCSDVSPAGTEPQKLGAEHVDNDSAISTKWPSRCATTSLGWPAPSRTRRSAEVCRSDSLPLPQNGCS